MLILIFSEDGLKLPWKVGKAVGHLVSVNGNASMLVNVAELVQPG